MLSAEQVIELLRELQEQIPGFAIVPYAELRKIRRAGYDVDSDLKREVVTAVGRSPVVQQVLDRTPDELREAQDDADRWASVETELRVVLRGVSTGNAIRRQRIAAIVRNACAVTRSLSETERHPDLVPHVKNITRIRKRKRGK
jgi:hypothetical protein